VVLLGHSRRHRSVVGKDSADVREEDAVAPLDLDNNAIANSLDFIWGTTTVAVGDTAVLHCSFDAIFRQLRNGNIDWVREGSSKGEDGGTGEPTIIATGRKVVVNNKRFRVYRPHNSALSVLIIRRAKKKDAGIFRCNLAGSSTRHKYMVLNVTESKIEAQTSPAKIRARVGKDVTLWCNATGYPSPVVYWTREDRNRKLPDGSYQYWGNGLQVQKSTEADTGIYACYLDNFVQPVVSYKFTLMVEDNPWNIDAHKMRFDSSEWHPHSSIYPRPVSGKSYLLMCETRGSPKPLPTIRWYRNGRRVRNNKHFYIIEDSPEWRSSYTSSTLVIMRFVPRFQANYTCVASNVFRMKKRTFNIQGLLSEEEVKDDIPSTTTAKSTDHHHLSKASHKEDNIVNSIPVLKQSAEEAGLSVKEAFLVNKHKGDVEEDEDGSTMVDDDDLTTDDEDYGDESGSGRDEDDTGEEGEADSEGIVDRD